MQRNMFKTKRLVIRPYKLSDYQEWFYAYTCCYKKRSKFDRGRLNANDCSKDIFKKIITRHQRLAKLDHTYVWGIFDKKSGRILGAIDIFIICRDVLQVANLGYRIFNLYWRSGFASEALKVAIPKILLDLKLNRLQASIDLDNTPSTRLAKSLMKSEGIVKNYHYQSHKWEDQKIFSITRKDLKLPVLHPHIYRP